MKRYLFLSSLLAAFYCATPAHASCAREWDEIVSSPALDNDAKAERLEQLGADCSGDAAYVHRWASLLVDAARFDEAERMVRQAIGEHHAHEVLAVLEYDLVDIERARLFHAGDPGDEALRGVLDGFLQHTEKFPQHAPGFAAASGLYLLLGEPGQAANFSRKAIAIEPDYLAYRSLAIAATRLSAFALAIDSAISASELNPVFRRDIDLMMSVAYAYISVDDVANAKASLGALLRARPEVRGSEQFDRLVAFVYQRAEELERAVD